MSSSVGHALCGICCLSLARGTVREVNFLRGWHWIAGFALLANLPDLDLLVGYFGAGNLHRFHSGASHSLLAAVVAAALVSLILTAPLRRRAFPWLLLVVASHPLIDLFVGRQPGWTQSYGVMLFWPFSADRVRMSWSLFYGIDHMEWDAFASLHNLGVVFSEVVVFGTPALMLRRWAQTRMGVGNENGSRER